MTVNSRAKETIREQRCDELLAMSFEQATKVFPMLAVAHQKLDPVKMDQVRQDWATRSEDAYMWIKHCMHQGYVAERASASTRVQELAAMKFESAIQIYPGLRLQYNELSQHEQSELKRSWAQHNMQALKPYILRFENEGAFNAFEAFPRRQNQNVAAAAPAADPKAEMSTLQLSSEIQRLKGRMEQLQQQRDAFSLQAQVGHGQAVQFQHQDRMDAWEANQVAVAADAERNMEAEQRQEKEAELAAWAGSFHRRMEGDIDSWYTRQLEDRMRDQRAIDDQRWQEEERRRAQWDREEAERKAAATRQVERDLQAERARQMQQRLNNVDRERSGKERDIDQRHRMAREEAQRVRQRQRDSERADLVRAHERNLAEEARRAEAAAIAESGGLKDRLEAELGDVRNRIARLTHEYEGRVLDMTPEPGQDYRHLGAAPNRPAMNAVMTADQILTYTLDDALSNIPQLRRGFHNMGGQAQMAVREDWNKRFDPAARDRLKQFIECMEHEAPGQKLRWM